MVRVTKNETNLILTHIKASLFHHLMSKMWVYKNSVALPLSLIEGPSRKLAMVDCVP